MSRELQLLNDLVTQARVLDSARKELDDADQAWNGLLATCIVHAGASEVAYARLSDAETAEAAALQGLRTALAALDAHDALALHLDAAGAA